MREKERLSNLPKMQRWYTVKVRFIPKQFSCRVFFLALEWSMARTNVKMLVTQVKIE
jgi:hypothetical protein